MGRTLRDLKDLRAKRKYRNSIIINNWDELREWAKENGVSDTHILEVKDCCAWLKLKPGIKDRYNPKHRWEKNIPKTRHYLSTHAFYGKGQWLSSTIMAHCCGFNIIFKNWDANSEGQDWSEPNER